MECRPYLTPAELCQRWHINRRTLLKLLGPRLPVLKITPRVWRIHLEDIERYEHSERIGKHCGA